ncbi:MAG: UvrD-helicase domain-containing protein, partial [Planctomycetota bacterium]|nr:UvrD-helicase domain-containing protein [Planctomycetota bacterium]
MRRDIERLDCGRDRRFTILDENEQQEVIKECIKACGGDADRLKPAAIAHRLSRAKGNGWAPDDFQDDKPSSVSVAEIYRAYEKRLREMNALDFDDLLLLAAQMLEKNSDLLSAYHRRYRYLLIDEYQDTNRLQYILARLLAGPQRNIHATGDPDQSIYSWRGADYRNIMDFQKDFPGTRLVRLEENYRSTAIILNLANHLIRHNAERIDKELFTSRQGGCPASLACLDNERNEALYIAQQIDRLRREGVALRRIAVLYRINAQSRPLEEAMIRLRLPYQLVGGIRFYERREIKDLLAHLKLLVNPHDTIALRRILHARPAGVGEKTIERLE